jgi:hypothetical protein
MSIAEGQHTLQLGEIPHFRHIVSLSQPFRKELIVIVLISPLIVWIGFDLAPPPRVDVEVINVA